MVDPGGAPERILREVQALGLTVVSILHTHAHFDHFLASGAMKHATGQCSACTRRTAHSGTCWRHSAVCSVCPTYRRRRRIIG